MKNEIIVDMGKEYHTPSNPYILDMIKVIGIKHRI